MDGKKEFPEGFHRQFVDLVVRMEVAHDALMVECKKPEPNRERRKLFTAIVRKQLDALDAWED